MAKKRKTAKTVQTSKRGASTTRPRTPGKTLALRKAARRVVSRKTAARKTGAKSGRQTAGTKKSAGRSAARKYVYFFGSGKADGDRSLKDLLGGKGAGLAEMTAAGLPVPPACIGRRDEHYSQAIKTYIDERYKLTVYYERDYGELFDLQEDPGEVRNLWSVAEHANLKSELTRKLLFAEMGKEPLWMPRISGA